ncbi:hypothetical protein M407DRAFT_240514, partial [Tulasnella calospora MUT 4182]
NRWILVEFLPSGGRLLPELESNNEPDTTNIRDAIRESVIQNFGESGWGSVGDSLYVKYYSPTTKICIIRVARDHHRIAWAAITLITELRNQACIPHVIHVSGTLKKVQLAAIQYNRVLVAKLKARSNEERQKQLTDYLEKSDKDINTIDGS